MKKEWLVIAIITFAVICAWVIFDILHVRANIEIDPKVSKVIEPTSPDFDISGLK